jgi:anti-anti-sigma factor
MRIQRTTTKDGAVFRLIGRLESGAARQLQRVLIGPATDGGTVIVDMSALEACDAEGLGALRMLAKRARETSGTLVLASPPDHIQRLIAESDARDELRVDVDAALDARYLFHADSREPFA